MAAEMSDDEIVALLRETFAMLEREKGAQDFDRFAVIDRIRDDHPGFAVSSSRMKKLMKRAELVAHVARKCGNESCNNMETRPGGFRAACKGAHANYCSLACAEAAGAQNHSQSRIGDLSVADVDRLTSTTDIVKIPLRGTPMVELDSMPVKQETVMDPHMGRVMITTRDVEVGETLFIDDSVLTFSKLLGACLACYSVHMSDPCEGHLQRFAVLAPVLDDQVSICEEAGVDFGHGHLWIMIICKFIGDAFENPTHKCWRMFDMWYPGPDLWPTDETGQLMRTIDGIKKRLPASHANVITTEQMARLVVTWNTNVHAITDISGCGMFPLGAIMEHACLSNSNIVTVGTRMIVSAIERIPAGARVTSSYVGIFRPTADRQARMQKQYGFTCTCVACVSTGADKCRAFVCPACKSGVVCVRNDGSEWKCESDKCQHVATEEETARMLAAEQAIAPQAPANLDVAGTVHAGVLHHTHYFVYRAADAQLDAAIDKMENDKALQLVLWLLSALERMHEKYSAQKAVYFQVLGRLRTAMGEKALARNAYVKAYHYLAISSGVDTPGTAAARERCSAGAQDAECSIM